MLSKRVDRSMEQKTKTQTNMEMIHYETGVCRPVGRLDFSTNSAWTIGYTHEVGPPYIILYILKKSIPGGLRLKYKRKNYKTSRRQYQISNF